MTTEFELGPLARAAEGDAEVVRVEARVPDDLAYFEGHFPERPVLPAVAQLNKLVLRAVVAAWPALVSLRRVTKLKFRKPLSPGVVLALRLTRRDAQPRVDFVLEHGGAPCAMGTLEFAAP